MIDLEKINRSVKKFSLIGGDSQPGSYDNFRDVLLRWAGQLRRAGLAYEINFIQPGKSNYRLRSNKEFEGNEIEKQITFPPRKSTLKVVIENMDPDQLAAVERELKVLIDTVKEDDFESAIEPELNLLRPRAFLAELKVEFQRWERYETPLLLAVCSINAENVSWQDVGREFKHLAKMTDIIGCFPDEKIAGIFPGESGDSRPEKKISNRLKERFGTKISLSFNCVPEDLEQYSSLEKQVTG